MNDPNSNLYSMFSEHNIRATDDMSEPTMQVANEVSTEELVNGDAKQPIEQFDPEPVLRGLAEQIVKGDLPKKGTRIDKELKHLKGLSQGVTLDGLQADLDFYVKQFERTQQATESGSHFDGAAGSSVQEELTQEDILAQKLAENMLKNPNLEDEWEGDLSLTGYKATRSLARSCLLFLGRTLLPRSSSQYNYGKTASGKTELILTTVRFFPEERVLVLTDITPRFLYRAGGEDGNAFRGKILVLGEQKPLRKGEDDAIQRAIRQFVSDNKLSLGSVDEVGGGRAARTLVIHGPVTIAFSGTSSPSDWDDQIINRSYCQHFKHTHGSIALVLKAKATTGSISSNPLVLGGDALHLAQKKWQAAWKLLKRLDPDDRNQINAVEIPFLEALIFKKSRLTESDMRTFELLKDSIAVSALINQRMRTVKSEQGKTVLVATWQDYENIKETFLDMMPRTSQGLANDLLETFSKKLLPWWKEDVNQGHMKTRRELSEALGSPYETVRRWIHAWLEADLLEEESKLTQDRRDNKKFYRLAKEAEAIVAGMREASDPGIDGVSEPLPVDRLDLSDRYKNHLSDLNANAGAVSDQSGLLMTGLDYPVADVEVVGDRSPLVTQSFDRSSESPVSDWSQPVTDSCDQLKFSPGINDLKDQTVEVEI